MQRTNFQEEIGAVYHPCHTYWFVPLILHASMQRIANGACLETRTPLDFFITFAVFTGIAFCEMTRDQKEEELYRYTVVEKRIHFCVRRTPLGSDGSLNILNTINSQQIYYIPHHILTHHTTHFLNPQLSYITYPGTPHFLDQRPCPSIEPPSSTKSFNVCPGGTTDFSASGRAAPALLPPQLRGAVRRPSEGQAVAVFLWRFGQPHRTVCSARRRNCRSSHDWSKVATCLGIRQCVSISFLCLLNKR